MLLQYIPMEDQDADILTMALTRRKFEYHRDMFGVKDNPFLLRGSVEFQQEIATPTLVWEQWVQASPTLVWHQEVLAAPTLVWAKFGVVSILIFP